MLIHGYFDQEELNCFEKVGKTQARGSCSIIWQGQFYIFGGNVETEQISLLTGYKLKRVGNLGFDHKQE